MKTPCYYVKLAVASPQLFVKFCKFPVEKLLKA